MDLGLANKAVLVFGASAGIGAACAKVFAADGARLALAARNAAALTESVTAFQVAGVEAIAVPVDLTVAGDAERAVLRVLDHFGRIDVVVISAGAARGGLFWELDDEVWSEAFALKFMGMVRVMRAAAPIMRDAGSGSIVAIVGNNGRQPAARMLPGSAANAACLAVVKGLADELAPSGVRVLAVNPGPTRTGRWHGLMQAQSASTGRSPAEVEADYLAAIPLGRISEPQEIARLVAIAASAVTPTLTGVSLTADGGATKSII